MRLGLVLLVAGAAVLAVLAASPSHAQRPSLNVAPAFKSSAPTVYFANATYNYVLTSSVPVNWTKVTAPSGFALTGGPLSAQADLQGDEANSGTKTFSIESTTPAYEGSVDAWQNWTVRFLTDPFISSSPLFTPSAGSAYDYKPILVNGGGATWTFSGASWLAFNSATGEVSGTVAAGTYLNQLTVNTSAGTWTQAWYTSTTSLPSVITFSGVISAHSVMVTLPTTDSTGLGNGGVFLGNLIQLNPLAYSSAEGYTATSAALSWNVSFSVFPTPWTPTPNATLYYYGAPGTTVSPLYNGVAEPVLVIQSSGVATEPAFPAAPQQGTPGQGDSIPSGYTPKVTGVSAIGTQATVSWSSANSVVWDSVISWGSSCSNLTQQVTVLGNPGSLLIGGLTIGGQYCVEVKQIGPYGVTANSAGFTFRAGVPQALTPITQAAQSFMIGPFDGWKVIGTAVGIVGGLILYARRWPGAILLVTGILLVVFL